MEAQACSDHLVFKPQDRGHGRGRVLTGDLAWPRARSLTSFNPSAKSQTARRNERTELAQTMPCHKSRVKCCTHSLCEDNGVQKNSGLGHFCLL